MSEGLALEPMQPVHVADWARWRCEPRTLRHNPVGDLPADVLRARIDGWDGRLVDQGRREYRWVILREGSAVGTVAVDVPAFEWLVQPDETTRTRMVPVTHLRA